jgi:TRAP-type mannitol/chloroaromatic compound transport system substrate-binding protein
MDKPEKNAAELGVDGASRRNFIGSAVTIGAGAGAAVAMPGIARAQSQVTLKFQSTWPNKDIFHEFAKDFVDRVNAIGKGQVQIQLLEANAIVPAFQVLDAVNAGILDGGHDVAAYWYGKNKAFSLFGTAPPFGWNANQLLGWFHYGGGRALYDELLHDVMKVNVVGFMSGPMPTQPLGWFKSEITSADQLRNLKYRTVGLSADLFKELGTAVTILPGGEIVPALDRGLIDGAEFNNPSSDRVLGFADVSKIYMVQSYHQSLECFEILFNRTKFDSLTPEAKAIIRYSAEAASADMSWKQQDRYSKDLQALKDAGVKVIPTPKAVLDAQLAAWDKVIEQASANPFFKKVIDSQRAWAQRVVAWQFETEAAQQPAYDHFFKKA